jgi:CRP-like cAMP-binding protein
MYASLQNLTEAANLSSIVVEYLNDHIDVKHFSKGSLLLKQGQRCNHIYIIETGFARIFSTLNDKEITTLFARENDIITSTHALFTQDVSQENIELLEDSVLLKINYNELINRCEVHPEFFTFYRVGMEKYYLLLEERTLSLQFDNALERYRKLLYRHPFILQRASLGQIASYLGMSPVTLSRMRRNI